MTRIFVLSLAALALSGCISRPVTDYKQEVWTAQKSNVKDHLHAVQFLDERNGYVVGEKGLILRTTDGGANWEQTYPIAVQGKELRGISFVNALQGWVISEKQLYRTNDGGSSWTEIRDFEQKHGDTLRAVRFITPGVGFVVGTKGLYQTLDGNDWAKVDIAGGSAVEPAGEAVFVAGSFVYSTNLQGAYTAAPGLGQLCAGADDCGAAMHFRTASDGWLLAGSGKLFGTASAWTLKRTRDGGATWTDGDPKGTLRKLVTTMGPWLPRVKFATENHGWVIQNGDFIATDDGGQTWIRQAQFRVPNFQPWSVESAAFGFRDITLVGSNAWLVGTEGRIYKFENRYYAPYVDDNALQIGPWRCCK